MSDGEEDPQDEFESVKPNSITLHTSHLIAGDGDTSVTDLRDSLDILLNWPNKHKRDLLHINHQT